MSITEFGILIGIMAVLGGVIGIIVAAWVES